MLHIATDIQSLTTFHRPSVDFIKHLKKSKPPMVLKLNGQAAAMVRDAKAYRRLLDISAKADAKEGTRQALGDAKRGKLRPDTEFLAEFESARGLSR